MDNAPQIKTSGESKPAPPSEASTVDQFLACLDRTGLQLSDETRDKVRNALSPENIVDLGRMGLSKLLGLESPSRAQIRLIKTSGELDNANELFSQLLKGPLLEEYAFLTDAFLAPSRVTFLADISDTVDFEPDGSLSSIVDSIFHDPDTTAAQGVFWNVLASPSGNYVLKLEKRQPNRTGRMYARETLKMYPIVRDTIGPEFLLEQACYQVPHRGKTKTVIFQKQFPSSALSIDINHLEDLNDPNSALAKLFEHPQAREKALRFVQGARELLEQHNLAIDTVGTRNIVIYETPPHFNIKLPDYGCTKYRKEDPLPKNVQSAITFLNGLEQWCLK